MEKICLRKFTNLRIDTGLLDSHYHFGINSEPQNRFSYRRITECAPLRTDGYSLLNTSAPLFSSQNASVDFVYGGHISPLGDSADGVNLTYRIPISSPTFYVTDADYTLECVIFWIMSTSANVTSTEFYQPGSLGGSTFRPIPELRQEDALTALFFLSAGNVQFLEPVDDDWYSAHKSGPPWQGSDGSFQVYYSDHTANVLGCVVRRQVCNPVSSKCSPLTYEMPSNMTWNSKEQENTYQFWLKSVVSQSLSTLDIPEILHLSALTARSNFWQGVQGYLPPDQWQEEVISWESISLADLQRAAVEAVTGPSDSSVQQYLQKNVTGNKDFCVDQKIRSTAYTNFSVLGLTITLAVGGLFIVLSEIIEPLCGFLKRRNKRYAYKRLEWVTNETLQLQRMVYEKLGLGTWSGASSKVPVTKKNEKLGILDVSNEEHPYIIRPVSDQSLGDRDNGSQNPANAASNLLDKVSKNSQNTITPSDSNTSTGKAHPVWKSADGGEGGRSALRPTLGSPNLDRETKSVHWGNIPTSTRPFLRYGNNLDKPSASSSSPSLTPWSPFMDPNEASSYTQRI
ncbi:MAG: hypothetical protein Q9227_003511 [Pyrenula ochraceoflavens]